MNLSPKLLNLVVFCISSVFISALAYADDLPRNSSVILQDDDFPYGIWAGDGDFTVRWSKILDEPYEVRFEKILRDLRRHRINALVPAHRPAGQFHLDTGLKHGVRIATMPMFLYRHLSRHPLANPETMDWVKEKWDAHIEAVGEHPALLAYHLYDEPTFSMCGPILELVQYLSQKNLKYPLLYTHQSLPLDEQKQADEWGLVSSMKVLLSDCYSLYGPYGRDPWLYGDITLPELARANPSAPQWPIIQSFGYGQIPEIPELGVMVYHTVANGAKGMFYFVVGQSYIAWYPSQPGYIAPGNLWFGESAYLEEIERIGAHLTTAGPLLLPLDHDADYPVKVTCDVFHPRVRTQLRVLLSPTDQEVLTRPVIHAGAFKGDQYDILVVHNNDPRDRRTGEVEVTGRRQAYDLLTLEQVGEPTDDGTKFTVDFAPGDGRLYLLGDEEAFQAAAAVVWRKRFQHAATLLSDEMELAAHAGVNLGDLPATFAELLEDSERMETDAGVRQLVAVQDEVDRLVRSNPDLAAIRQSLEAMRSQFVEMDEWFLHHPEYLYESFPQHADTMELVSQLVKLSGAFGRLENDINEGKLDLPAAHHLQMSVAELNHKVLTFRPAELMSERIAIVRIGAETDGQRDLKRYLDMLYETVDDVTLKDDLSTYDLLWVHLDGTSSAIAGEYCERLYNLPLLLEPLDVDTLRNYVNDGGGLICTGLAPILADELGLEVRGPTEVYSGVMYTPGNAEMDWPTFTICNKVMGLKPTVKGHPLFDGFEHEGFGVELYDVAELISKAVWKRSDGRWPQQGTVLAGYYSDGADLPDDYAVAVEYRLGIGKILLLGDVFDPSLGRTRVSGLRGRDTRWNSAYHTLLKNIVATYGRSAHRTEN